MPLSVATFGLSELKDFDVESCAKSLNGKWIIMSGLILGRLRFQLLGLIIREIGLFL